MPTRSTWEDEKKRSWDILLLMIAPLSLLIARMLYFFIRLFLTFLPSASRHCVCDASPFSRLMFLFLS